MIIEIAYSLLAVALIIFVIYFDDYCQESGRKSW